MVYRSTAEGPLIAQRAAPTPARTAVKIQDEDKPDAKRISGLRAASIPPWRLAKSGIAHTFTDVTDWLEQAVRSARLLPAAMQDDLARLILDFAGESGAAYELSTDQDQSFSVSEAAAARGEFATDAEVSAVWAKHGL